MNKEQFFKEYEPTNGGVSGGITFSYCELTIGDRSLMFTIREESTGTGTSYDLTVFCDDEEDIEFLKGMGFNIKEENNEVLDKDLERVVFEEYQHFL